MQEETDICKVSGVQRTSVVPSIRTRSASVYTMTPADYKCDNINIHV